ncbi:MAG: dTDP-4-amino-4,6-dideoxygalactose transaminase [Clostridiales bacterium]|nr:dTDP-4-amino-4,6-dideoxygalactose transaminase [Clostridiales bacterium]
MIPFNKASITDKEVEYAVDAMKNSRLSGDGNYTRKVYEKFEALFGIQHMLLTTSGTSALEMASILANLQPGDEVIVPSFTFSSTVNASMLRGAKPVFCDIRADNLNIDEKLIEGLITPNTKAIYTVDFAGVPCEMDTINEIAKRHNLMVIEDAAQAVGSKYKGRIAGTLAPLGCYSFHETKNYVMGEGGAIVLNDESFIERAEIIREKGTNRSQLLNGLVDKYTWHDIGSSFLPSDILAAILYAQMERFQEIMDKRLHIWNSYYAGFKPLENDGLLKMTIIPDYVEHNGHMFYIILPDVDVRTNLIDKLKEKGVNAYISYVPLHSSPFGRSMGYVPETCPITEEYGQRCLRMPLYADMTDDDIHSVIDGVTSILRS